MKRLDIALLFGGKSNEFQVSGRSAATLLRALREAGHRVFPLGISRQGDWYYYHGREEAMEDGSWESSAALTPFWVGRGGFFTEAGRLHRPQVIFPALHGQNCEDGRLQGFLDTWGIPYVGCGTPSSVLCMDKAASKAVATQVGVPTLPWVKASPEGAEEAILGKLSFPLFIKPVCSGSSRGASAVFTREELAPAIAAAAKEDAYLLAEPFVRGRELEVAILEEGGVLTVSAVGEVCPNATFYDYDTKYSKDSPATTHIPADLPSTVSDTLRHYAATLFRALGCRHLARVDFFLCEEGCYFNEINTLPGFTSISMYPSLMAHAGIPLPQLATRLCEAALL